MSKAKKTALLVTSSLVALILLYSYLCFIFLPKDISEQGGEYFYRGKGFLAEPVNNSLDIIAFGHSGVYSGFSPATLFSEFGYTSYASGAAKQTGDKINGLLHRALKNQKPKIALLDVDCFYHSPKASEIWSVVGAPFVFHSRWKTLKARDFYQIPGKLRQSDPTKGFKFSRNTSNVKYYDYMGDPDSAPLKMPKNNLKQLNKIVRFCNKNDIQVIFIDFANMTSWNYAKHNYIRQYADKHGIFFLDMNVAKETFPMEFDKSFRDNGNHYNVYGAEKATRFLGKFLKEKFGSLLADKRNDPKFSYWQDAVEYYNEQFEK